MPRSLAGTHATMVTISVVIATITPCPPHVAATDQPPHRHTQYTKHHTTPHVRLVWVE